MKPTIKPYRNALAQPATATAYVPPINANDFQLFQEFLKFKALQGGGDVPAVPSPFVARKIDYNWVLGIMMDTLSPRGGNNPHLFWHFKHLWTQDKTKFVLTGELHSEADGRHYFSFAYCPGTDHRVNFHAYGRLVNEEGRHKFMVDSCDIYMRAERYPDACLFGQGDEDEE